MNKAELITAIKALLPEALMLEETATNAQLEVALIVLEAPAKAEAAEDAFNDLKESHAAQAEEIEELKQSVVDLNNELTNATLAASKTKVPAAVIVDHDGKKYQVKHGGTIIFDEVSKVYSKEEIAENKELLTHLIGMGSGMVEEV
jgi:hypothetical protein